MLGLWSPGLARRTNPQSLLSLRLPSHPHAGTSAQPDTAHVHRQALAGGCGRRADHSLGPVDPQPDAPGCVPPVRPSPGGCADHSRWSGTRRGGTAHHRADRIGRQWPAGSGNGALLLKGGALDGAGGFRSERRHQSGAAIRGGTPATDRGGAACASQLPGNLTPRLSPGHDPAVRLHPGGRRPHDADAVAPDRRHHLQQPDPGSSRCHPGDLVWR